MQSDPSLLADMQNLMICWWTFWFLTNLLVDTPSNKIIISSCCGERRTVKCPICPCPFFYTSFFFPICSEQHRVLPSPSPSSTSAPQRHRRWRLRPSSEPHRVLPPPSSLPLRATPWPSRATTGMATVAAAAGAARPPRLPPRVHRTRVDRAYTRQSHPPSLDLFIPHASCQSCGAIDGLHMKLMTRLSLPLLHTYKERPRTPLCSLRLPRPPELPPAPQRPHLPPRPPLTTGF